MGFVACEFHKRLLSKLPDGGIGISAIDMVYEIERWTV